MSAHVLTSLAHLGDGPLQAPMLLASIRALAAREAAMEER